MSHTQAHYVTGYAPPSCAAAGIDWRGLVDEGRALIRLAFPIALIAFVNMGMSVTDTVMVSKMYGAEALAAVAVGSDLYSILFYLCAGALGGIAPFYTAAVTRKDANKRSRLERSGWMMASLLAAMAVPAVWFSPIWLERFGLQRDLLELGRGYTQSIALTLIPMLGVAPYRTILTAAEKPKVFLKVTIAMLPLNAVGNYVLMEGFGPIPSFGPTGAGLSSLLVATASLAVLVFIARRASSGGARTPAFREWFDWRGMGSLIRVGLPIGIATATETGVFLGATLYAATLGTADVAAHTLTLRMSGVAYAGSAALLQAAMVRIARAETLRDASVGRAVITSSLAVSATLGLLLCLLIAAGADAIAATFFAVDHAGGAAATRIAAQLLILLGIIELFAYPGLAAAGLLRGRKDTRMPMVCTIVGYWAVGAPVGLYLCEAHAFGAAGIWIGLSTGAAASALLTIARLARWHSSPRAAAKIEHS
jgi:MATE family multidrug resistance protein